METPARCPRCGRETPPNARFCSGCGVELRSSGPRIATGLLPSNQMLRNRYRVEQRLAQGGQSAVYLAYDLYENNAVRAIKEMSESNLNAIERENAVNDFNREAEMLRRLDHPALAKVFDTFVEGQKHFLVMEYVPGHNLEDELMEAGRPLPWERIVVWGIALAEVLQYLHNQEPPIIYRDLKPANVMLMPNEHIKLIDFGIARWLHPQRQHDTAQLGTDGYAPLEQYSARSERRSDLYALGASLYHLLTGRVPEAAPLRIAGQALTSIRAINPQTPEAVEHVITRALSLQPRDRFENATAMGAALDWARYQGSTPSGRLNPMRSHPTQAPFTPSHASRPTQAPPTPGFASTAEPSIFPPMPSSPSVISGQISRPTSAPAPAHGTVGTAASNGASMGRLPTDTQRPKLHIWPLRLDAGLLDLGEAVSLTLDIANEGGGVLTGSTETNMPCLTVTPALVEPGVSTLAIRLDTTDLRPGPYICHIAVRTNGGAQIIPVRFTVQQAQSGRRTSGGPRR